MSSIEYGNVELVSAPQAAELERPLRFGGALGVTTDAGGCSASCLFHIHKVRALLDAFTARLAIGIAQARFVCVMIHKQNLVGNFNWFYMLVDHKTVPFVLLTV